MKPVKKITDTITIMGRLIVFIGSVAVFHALLIALFQGPVRLVTLGPAQGKILIVSFALWFAAMCVIIFPAIFAFAIDKLRFKVSADRMEEFSIEGTIVSIEDSCTDSSKKGDSCVFGTDRGHREFVFKILLDGGDTITASYTSDAILSSCLGSLCGKRVSVDVKEWYNSRGEVIKRSFTSRREVKEALV